MVVAFFGARCLTFTGVSRATVSSDQAGVSLLELAIAFPLLLTLLIGVTNYGFTLREWQALADIAKQSAHHAASFNATDSGNIPCTDIVAKAREIALTSMRANNIDPANFEVPQAAISSAPYPLLSPVGNLQLITVTLNRLPESPGCVFCTERYFNNSSRTQASATFALEGAQGCTGG